MVVELICVGTELLLGNIVNTNAAFLSEQCAALGLSNYYQTVVGDNEERLKGVMKTAMERSDIVILLLCRFPWGEPPVKVINCPKLFSVRMASRA